VAMTITGASINSNIIQKLGPRSLSTSYTVLKKSFAHVLKCGQIRQYHDEYGHFLSSKIIFSKEKHRPTVKNANCQDLLSL
jgi:hypothetical protein